MKAVRINEFYSTEVWQNYDQHSVLGIISDHPVAFHEAGKFSSWFKRLYCQDRFLHLVRMAAAANNTKLNSAKSFALHYNIASGYVIAASLPVHFCLSRRPPAC